MTDIDNWIELLRNDKKKRFVNISDDEATNILRLLAVDTLSDALSGQKLKGRRLTNELNNLKKLFNDTKSIFLDLQTSKEFTSTLNAFVYIMNDIIEDIKVDIYSNSNLDITKHLNKLRRQYGGKSKYMSTFKDEYFDFRFDVRNTVKFDEEESETEEDDTEEYESTDDDYDVIPSNREMTKKFNTEIDTLMNSNNNSIDDAFQYFNKLDSNKKLELVEKFKEMNTVNSEDEPALIKILQLDTSLKNRKTLCSKFISINSGGFSDKSKLKDWVSNAMKLPFGVYKGVNIKKLTKPEKITKFLHRLEKKMNKAVYGHDDAKEHIIQMMSQLIRNPNAKGNVFGLYGPPGNGKTSLIKEGIAKAMKKPFEFISLGGATDASFLEGHSFTYEGSIYGRIAQGLMNSKCMDPIFYFDELDKISNTPKGMEIVNLLVHLTDPVQNCHFKDKYFYDLDLDLSKATFIFSFNDISNVNYILRDRITCIPTKFLNVPQKLHIGSKYLLPSILKDIGLNKKDISIDTSYMNKIIQDYTYEGGVRKLKKVLYDFCRKLNTFNLTGKHNIEFPYILNEDMYSLLTDKYNTNTFEKVHRGNNVGMVNGLWANSMGVGGVLPIESTFIPTKKPFEIKTTGSLMKVIKESINVAQSVAWNNLDEDTQLMWMKKWRKNPQSVHIHCPDGSTPKDGPSAGAAMTLTIYSQLTGKVIRGDVAMTGEINLRGDVTKIGGLEEKLTGAKRAGATLVLIPQENEEDIKQIRERNTDLFDDNFKVISVNRFEQVLEHSLV